ncbi:hypothetical protein P7K49_016984, partial [Saguinus oedipus]
MCTVFIAIHSINFLDEEGKWPIFSSNKFTGSSLNTKMRIDHRSSDVVTAPNYLELLLMQLLLVPM